MATAGSEARVAQTLAAEKQKVILEWLGLVLTGTKEKEWRGAAWALECVYPDAFAITFRHSALSRPALAS